MDNPLDAIRRYEEMTGRVHLDHEQAAVAARDRVLYGATYLPRDEKGEVIWNDLFVVRFMVEVCGLSFRESRAAVIENARSQGIAMPAEMPPAAEKARELLFGHGGIFAARSLAAINRDILAGDEMGAAYWRAVIEALETIRFVPQSPPAYDGVRQAGEGGAA